MAGCQTNLAPLQKSDESWEDKFDIEAAKERRDNEICQTLPKPWVLEVAEAKRELALEQLKSKPWQALSLEETKAMTTIALDTNTYPPVTLDSLAADLIWQAAENARKEPESREFTYCQTSAGLRCSDYLRELVIQKLPRGRTPFLIRSTWQNPGTGRYDVEECESGVVVTHSSLSRTSSEPENNPLIVFLKRPPQDIFSFTSVAE